MDVVGQLREIRKRLAQYEGAHLDETVECNACNVYHHHGHEKTEWRGQACREVRADLAIARWPQLNPPGGGGPSNAASRQPNKRPVWTNTKSAPGMAGTAT